MITFKQSIPNKIYRKTEKDQDQNNQYPHQLLSPLI